MRLNTIALSLAASLTLTSAHFTLDWPVARGFNDDNAPNFPCGGFDTVSSNRTEFPLSGGPVQLNLHHTQTNLEVLLAVGNDPGSNYSIVLRPTFAEEGPGEFCVGGIVLPAVAGIEAGTNATIQVVSNGDPSGGLYQCADITFTNATISESTHCTNATGQKVTETNIQGSPNGTTSGGATGTASGSAASSTPTKGLAAHQTAATWLMGAVGVAAVALL